MTLYNTDALETLKMEYLASISDQDDTCVLRKEVVLTEFINHIKSKENPYFKNPNQLEIEFPDEDNSK